jgi:hypothetical protein
MISSTKERSWTPERPPLYEGSFSYASATGHKTRLCPCLSKLVEALAVSAES